MSIAYLSNKEGRSVLGGVPNTKKRGVTIPNKRLYQSFDETIKQYYDHRKVS
jgi:hypothetical protein